MLIGIIEKDYIGSKHPDRKHSGSEPITADHHRNADRLQAPRHHQGFVSRFLGSHEKSAAVADNATTFLSPPFVSPADDHRLEPEAVKHFRQINRHRSFTGATDSNVTNRNDLAGELIGF
jgi:hypothetical protein